jgi:hypothetical protein
MNNSRKNKTKKLSRDRGKFISRSVPFHSPVKKSPKLKNKVDKRSRLQKPISKTQIVNSKTSKNKIAAIWKTNKHGKSRTVYVRKLTHH